MLFTVVHNQFRMFDWFVSFVLWKFSLLSSVLEIIDESLQPDRSVVDPSRVKKAIAQHQTLFSTSAQQVRKLSIVICSQEFSFWVVLFFTQLKWFLSGCSRVFDCFTVPNWGRFGSFFEIASHSTTSRETTSCFQRYNQCEFENKIFWILSQRILVDFLLLKIYFLDRATMLCPTKRNFNFVIQHTLICTK